MSRAAKFFAPTATLCALFCSASLASGQEVLTFEGDVPDDGLDHFLIPFAVPAGTVEIEVSHDDLSAENILDWGLEDPSGFRGWGGGNSENAIVGVDAASRSYVPGPIAAGQWAVVVGKAKIVETPAQYSVTVTLRQTPTLAAQSERRPYESIVVSDERRWYAGDFHVHSRESGDATPSLDQIAEFASGKGLDFVEITDHNTHTAQDFFGDVQSRFPDFLLMPGIEVTTYQGHANAIGATEWVDHKTGFDGLTIQDFAEQSRAQGLFSLMHPGLDVGDLCIGCGWSHELEADQIDALEIGTGGWEQGGFVFSPKAIELWDTLSDTGAHIAALGGSDDHNAGTSSGFASSPIGDPTTMVFADGLSREGVLEAVRNSRTVVKLQGPDDPMVELQSSVSPNGDTVAGVGSLVLTARISGAEGQTARFVKNGEPLEQTNVTNDTFTLELPVTAPTEGEDRYRVELNVDGNPRTITSHVWVAAFSNGSGAGGVGGQSSGGSGAEAGSAAAGGGSDGGCGCSAVGGRGGAGWASLWLLAALMLRRREIPMR